MSGDDVTQLREDMRDLKADVKEDIKGIYTKLDDFIPKWNEHVITQSARMDDLEDLIHREKLGRAKCFEDEQTQIAEIKKVTDPMAEKGKFLKSIVRYRKAILIFVIISGIAIILIGCGIYWLSVKIPALNGLFTEITKFIISARANGGT